MEVGFDIDRKPHRDAGIAAGVNTLVGMFQLFALNQPGLCK